MKIGSVAAVNAALARAFDANFFMVVSYFESIMLQCFGGNNEQQAKYSLLLLLVMLCVLYCNERSF